VPSPTLPAEKSRCCFRHFNNRLGAEPEPYGMAQIALFGGKSGGKGTKRKAVANEQLCFSIAWAHQCCGLLDR
jgi:hypothetical protein